MTASKSRTPPKTAPKALTAKLTADRLGKLPRRVPVGIYLDDTVVAAFSDADVALTAARERLDASRPRRLAEARAAASPEQLVDGSGASIVAMIEAQDAEALEPLEKKATQALDALDATTRWFTFRSMGRTAYRELLDKHPPRDEDHQRMADAGEGEHAPYNLETFPPALIQECCIDPVLHDADITAIFAGDTWNAVEIQTLLAHAQLAQSQASVADKKRHRG